MTSLAGCIILNGKRRGECLSLSGEETLIGGSDECQFRLSDMGIDDGLNGVVARISFDQKSYLLTCTDPAMAVWMNDQPVAGHVPLKDGDIIGFGLQPRAVEFRWPTGASDHKQRDTTDHNKEANADGRGKTFRERLPAHMGIWLKTAAVLAVGVVIIVLLIKSHRALNGLTAQMQQQQQTLVGIHARLDQLQRQVSQAQAMMEGETGLIGKIAASYSPSICLIESRYQFIERGSGKVLREAQVPGAGITVFEGESRFQVTIEGTGPVFEETVIGTGFIIGRGLILTNLHVVRPWWKNDLADQILGHGFLPRQLGLNAYFPSVSDPFRLEVIGSSETTDLAVCRFNQGTLSVPTPTLAGSDSPPEVGQTVVLLGYPAGVEGLLSRLDESVTQSIVSSTSLRVYEVTRELARGGLIRPLPTQGHITAVLPSRIVHDAATTSGGSGGPLFNKDGTVVGIIYAVTEFSASNLAVPVSVIRDFIRQQGISL